MGVDKNLQAFVAGVTFVATVMILGVYITEGLSFVTLPGSLVIAFSALFIGVPIGYYSGQRSVIDPSVSFLLGLLVSLSAIILLSSWVSLVSGILVFSAATVFLMYNSDLAVAHDTVDTIITGLNYASLLGLAAIAVVYYGIPLVIGVLRWLRVLRL